MNKAETLDLLVAVNEYYNGFVNLTDQQALQKKINAWHMVLKGYEFESIMESLAAYVVTNDFPPKISQLVRNVSFNDPAYKIPNKEETRAYFDKLDAEIAEAKANPIRIEERDKLIEDALGTEFLNRLKAKRG